MIPAQGTSEPTDDGRGAVFSQRLHYWIAVAWVVPVLLSLSGAGQSSITIATTVAAVLSCVMILVKPAAVLVAIPFFALLSPVAGYFELPLGRILLSDALFILLAVQLLFLVIADRVRLRTNLPAQLGAAIAILYVVSTVSGIVTGTLISLKPILYVAQLVIIALYTNSFAKTGQSWDVVVTSWITATFFGALLLIQAFVTGRSLSRFDSAPGKDLVDLTSIEYLFRADYYYTGFHFAVGISIVILLLRLLVGRAQPQRMLRVLVVSVLMAAILMMLNKTAILAIGITLVTVFLLLMPRLRRTVVVRAIAAVAVGAVAGYVVVSSVFLTSIGDVQRTVWGESAIGTGSLAVRLAVYVSAVTAWMGHPVQVVLGMGPDFLEGSGNPAMAMMFKTSSITGLAEGTVDSGWISYLTELGIVAFVALVWWVAQSVRSIYRCVMRADSNELDMVAVSVLAGLVFTAIALSTQMLGYTKVTWFPFQLLLIGFVHAPHAPSSDHR